MLRVLTLSTLFPDATRPNFGVFVERQTRGLAALDGIELKVMAPVGLPPFPLSLNPRHRSLRTLPTREVRNGLDILRPRFVALPGTQGRFHAATLLRALVPAVTALRRSFAFDVIDAEFFFPDGPAAVALGSRFGVPVSIKARGADIHLWGTAPPTARQVRRAGNAADGLLAVSQALANDMVGIGIEQPVRVHRTGVDHALFRPGDRATLKADWSVDGPLVASVGALIARKGHAVVIDAVAALPGVHLLIAGEGPDRSALEARIAASGAGDRIRLLGAWRHADLPRLFAAADVMALASASEGLANAWVEALACGTPIVITDAGGARELVDRPDAGRIVPRTAEAFRGAIAALLASSPAPEAVRATANRYRWEINAAELRDHLSALAARYASSRG